MQLDALVAARPLPGGFGSFPRVRAPDPAPQSGPWTWPDSAEYVSRDKDPAGVLLLDAADVMDKWGFDDGDVFGEPVTDWCLAHGWGAGDEAYGERMSWPYISDRVALWHVLHRCVFPRVDVPVGSRVVWFRGVHNPVRENRDRVVWSSQVVGVSAAEFDAVLSKLFPPPDQGWLDLFLQVRASLFPYGLAAQEFRVATALTNAGYALAGSSGALLLARLRADFPDAVEMPWTQLVGMFEAVARPAGG